MAATFDQAPSTALHPAHAFFLAATVPLLVGALLSDIAYAMSYEVQWTNFASWLIAGALLVGAVVLVLALLSLVRGGHRSRWWQGYFLLALSTWVLGFINALVHAKDAWASMPAGLVLSAIAAVLAIAATWLGFSRLPRSGPRAGVAS